MSTFCCTSNVDAAGSRAQLNDSEVIQAFLDANFLSEARKFVLAMWRWFEQPDHPGGFIYKIWFAIMVFKYAERIGVDFLMEVFQSEVDYIMMHGLLAPIVDGSTVRT